MFQRTFLLLNLSIKVLLLQLIKGGIDSKNQSINAL